MLMIVALNIVKRLGEGLQESSHVFYNMRNCNETEMCFRNKLALLFSAKVANIVIEKIKTHHPHLKWDTLFKHNFRG